MGLASCYLCKLNMRVLYSIYDRPLCSTGHNDLLFPWSRISTKLHINAQIFPGSFSSTAHFLMSCRYEVNQGLVGYELCLVMSGTWVLRGSESVEMHKDKRSSRGEGGLRNSWESRISLVKARRSMESVRRKVWVRGRGRTKGFSSRSSMMRHWSVMLRTECDGVEDRRDLADRMKRQRCDCFMWV